MEISGMWKYYFYHQYIAMACIMLLMGKSCSNAECTFESSECPSICECSVIGDILNVNCSDADLSVLPNILPQCDSLHLDISRNKLATLGYKYYMNASLTIDASHNLIASISDDFVSSFSGLKLQNLHLQNNKLTSLTEKEVDLLKRLKLVMLTDNPWSCDCEILEIQTWIRSNKKMVPPTHQELDNLACFLPKSLRGERIADVEHDDICEEPDDKKRRIWLPIVITVCCILYLLIISLIGICLVVRRRVKIVDEHKLDGVSS